MMSNTPKTSQLKDRENDTTFITRLSNLVSQDPNKAAFIFWDRYRKRTILTRQELWEKSTKFAAKLCRLGIVKGDIVCNNLTNSPERLITFVGTIISGAVSMNGDAVLADGEDILTQFRNSECKAVILDPFLKNGVASFLNRIKSAEICKETGRRCFEGLPHLTHVIPVSLTGDGKSLLRTMENEAEAYYVDSSVTKDDPAIIFNTSGSTGFSKQVVHSHKTFLEVVKLGNELLGCSSDSVMMNIGLFGWAGGAPAYFLGGHTSVVLDESSKIEEGYGKILIDMINYEKCTHALFSSTIIQSILKELQSGYTLDQKLQILSTSGGPISSVTIKATKEIAEKAGAIYGSTEAGIVFGLTVEDVNEYKDCCVGSPSPNISVEAKILNENQDPVGVGETGELYIRAPSVAVCYLNKPEESEKSFLKDGWFRTGDMACFDGNKELFVFCRGSNAINHNGTIYYPGWFEKRINTHPEIQASILVGVPDPIYGEDLCLCVVVTPQAPLKDVDLKRFCSSLCLMDDPDWVPTPKYFLFFDEFPIKMNGKVDRQSVRMEALKLLGFDAIMQDKK